MTPGKSGTDDAVPQDGRVESAGAARGARPERAQSRDEAVTEIRRLQEQLALLGREAIEQGSLREPGEHGQYAAERARLEERLDALRRELDPTALEELTEEERVAISRRYTIRLADGTVETWELTGPGEARPREGKISVQSPLGRALVGASPERKVEVETPEGSYVVEVVSVS